MDLRFLCGPKIDFQISEMAACPQRNLSDNGSLKDKSTVDPGSRVYHFQNLVGLESQHPKVSKFCIA